MYVGLIKKCKKNNNSSSYLKRTENYIISLLNASYINIFSNMAKCRLPFNRGIYYTKTMGGGWWPVKGLLTITHLCLPGEKKESQNDVSVCVCGRYKNPQYIPLTYL